MTYNNDHDLTGKKIIFRDDTVKGTLKKKRKHGKVLSSIATHYIYAGDDCMDIIHTLTNGKKIYNTQILRVLN